MTCWRCGSHLIVLDDDGDPVRREGRPKCLLCGRWQTSEAWRPVDWDAPLGQVSRLYKAHRGLETVVRM